MITCTFEDGGTGKLRHVTVGTILLNKKRDKILLIRRAGSSFLEPNKYDIPGGFMGRDETTEETSHREVKEETGYVIKVNSLFCINDNPNRPKEDRQNVELIYSAEAQNEEGKHDDEVERIQWFSLSELPQANDWAFDHFVVVQKFIEHTKNPSTLPIFIR